MRNGKKDAVKVLVVDDSAFMRKVISDILSEDSSINVLDTAKNGFEAIEKAGALKPDVITLDVEMPVMNGLSCLRELLKIGNFSVVMLSSLTKEGEDSTIRALEDGAVDFVSKPVNIFDLSNRDKKLEIIEKVKVAKNAVKARKHVHKAEGLIKKNTAENTGAIKSIVAIGTSTGGPRALQDVIPLIPGNIPSAFLIVQHMPPGFTRSLAERLNGLSGLTVKEAEDGEYIKAGHAYIAPGDYHMLLEKGQANSLIIKLSQSPPSGGHRPSVNVMMESLADTGFKNIAAVIMTGMGGDGSEGIKKIKRVNKGYIIAQDEKSCVVYGMPRVAVQTGAVDVIVPLKEIASEIMKFVGVHE